MTAGLDLSITASLCASLDRLSGMLGEQRNRRHDLQRALSYTPSPTLSLATLPAVRAADGGPNTGFFWAVQRITVGPFGASTDLVTVYRGHSTADTVPQNALNSFSTATVGAFVPWHLGGKGLILLPDESLVVGGTITGTNPVMSVDVIQGPVTLLFDYLI